MSDRPRILIIDSAPSDVELATLLIHQAYPHAAVDSARDATALLDALRLPAPDVVVIDPGIAWVGFEQVAELVARTWPTSATVLFGAEDTLIARCLRPGLALHALACKDSAGFMVLPALLRTVLARRPAGGTLAAWPLPALALDAAGTLREVNAAAAERLAQPAPALVGRPLGSLLASDAREAWERFRMAETPNARFPLAFGEAELCLGREATGGFVGCLLDNGTAPSLRVLGKPPRRGADELEELALVCSHDLKEPIQQVQRLVQRLEENLGENPRAAERTLRQLRDSANRASGMLNGLLSYLSVGTREPADDLVALDDCLREALDNLAPTIAETGARIETEPLPRVIGDAVQLTHLLQNLLSNALKFRGPDAPEIRVRATLGGDPVRIVVQDNGIGISANQRERVFEMGRRLHTQEEYPGTGMGLALCRRIAQRHGGSIHIEGGPDGGCVVVVELPAPPRHITRLA